ncbi:hypothetical protein B1759_04190 [Rubrivirga sp. SAORIC476]|uniref:hypothetical protein n=1 Tax=Rubrivirga sp. SAORIC476 TaxID=1961794 RepID=UPI000BA99F81|nr:hypothetical protein [Rubrivirga sp. SAORIC476]PAP80588.1 hypothetical protein B1759_04190 [Rubrivirga sp. SAORIC476]
MRSAFLLALLASAAHAQGLPADTASVASESSARFEVRGYGVVNYAAYDWDTDPARRTAMDVERLVLYPSVRLADRVTLRAEFEIEHAGTGSTLEFDVQEEFGEFEQEIEAGGEVVLEQLNVDFAVRPSFGVRVGKVKVPMGLAAVNDEPNEYYTTTRAEAEATMIPSNWYEVGVQAYGRAGAFAYVLSVVNGLDSSGFSSANWVQRGGQSRFETVTAENLAVHARLDVALADETSVGVSGYVGDSADNRPRPDLEGSAVVGIVDVHGQVERGPLTVRGAALVGWLGNADAVSRANRNLPNALGVRRTPVGSQAYGAGIEAGVDLVRLVPSLGGVGDRLDVFGRIDTYDTMASVTGDVFDNPRWQRTTYTAGLNWRPVGPVVLKAHWSHRLLGTTEDRVENTASLGLGFEF